MEIADEVELYARESGRTASLVFMPTLLLGNRISRGTWVVQFSLRPNDKRMQAYQQGLAPKPPTEEVWLHVPNQNEGKEIPFTGGQREPPYLALDIQQMGAGGVRAFLDKGNLWSGRGEFGTKTLEEIVKETRDREAAATAKFRADQKDENRHEMGERRRSILGIPFVKVGVDLKRRSAAVGSEESSNHSDGAAVSRAKES